MYDENNNFIQMDIEDGEVFHLSYNSGHDIKHATVKVSGKLRHRMEAKFNLNFESIIFPGALYTFVCV